ncbi:type II toxin-antitoxin system RelE/ParE family toxin [bacterium]|nr:type II toxin-antitoxin system RelE/ParE family toxin [bacterium]
MKEIKFYKLPNGKEPVKNWLLGLDKSLRVKVIRRIERIYDDNFGDFKQIESNLYELRFTLGKGYRIYYTIQNDVLVLLLNAGDKSRQSKDIELAKTYLKDIKDNKND